VGWLISEWEIRESVHQIIRWQESRKSEYQGADGLAFRQEDGGQALQKERRASPPKRAAGKPAFDKSSDSTSFFTEASFFANATKDKTADKCASSFVNATEDRTPDKSAGKPSRRSGG